MTHVCSDEEKLIAVQGEYIEFLSKLLADHEVFMANRRIHSTEGNIKLGKQFRESIKQLKYNID